MWYIVNLTQFTAVSPPSPSHSLHLPLLEIEKKRAILGGKRSWQAETAAPVNLGVVGADLVFSARDRAQGPRRAEEERDDYSSFSAGGREGDEVPRE